MTIYTEFGEITGIYNASKNETYYKNSMAVGSDTEEGIETVYNDTYPEGKDFPYSHHWHATEIKTGIDIKDDLFTW